MATKELFPLVYEELKALARKRVAREKSGNSLNATVLVHEAYGKKMGVRRFTRFSYLDFLTSSFSLPRPFVREVILQRAFPRSRKAYYA